MRKYLILVFLIYSSLGICDDEILASKEDVRTSNNNIYAVIVKSDATGAVGIFPIHNDEYIESDCNDKVNSFLAEKTEDKPYISVHCKDASTVTKNIKAKNFHMVQFIIANPSPFLSSKFKKGDGNFDDAMYFNSSEYDNFKNMVNPLIDNLEYYIYDKGKKLEFSKDFNESNK